MNCVEKAEKQPLAIPNCGRGPGEGGAVHCTIGQGIGKQKCWPRFMILFYPFLSTHNFVSQFFVRQMSMAMVILFYD